MATYDSCHPNPRPVWPPLRRRSREFNLPATFPCTGALPPHREGQGATERRKAEMKNKVAFVGLAPLLRTQQPQRRRRATCAPKMLEQNTILAVATALLGVGGGIGLMAWTEKQGERGAARVNTQKCAECGGATRVVCNVCRGTGKDPLADKDPTRDGPCKICEGQTTVRCFNCQGTGIQPRFLDRLSPEDFMD